MAGTKWRENYGGRNMAGTKWRENYGGRNMAGEEGRNKSRERETNSDQELHALIGFNQENSSKITSPVEIWKNKK